MTRAPWAAAVLKAGSLASPPRTSMSSGTGAVPERLTSRAVSPRRRRASRVARPVAPVPKITCCGLAFMLSQLLVSLGTGCRVGDHGVLAAAAEAAALATISQPVPRRSSSQLGGRSSWAVLRGWYGWGGGAQPVQHGPGQGHEGD